MDEETDKDELGEDELEIEEDRLELLELEAEELEELEELDEAEDSRHDWMSRWSLRV